MNRIGYDNEDDHFVKYKGPQKKAETTRKELLGVGPSRVPKAYARKMETATIASSQKLRDEALEYDPFSENPLRRVEQKELEQLAVRKAKEVTQELESVLEISKGTQAVGGETVVTLKDQNRKIIRTHEKAVQLEQEMKQGAKLLGQLEGFFGRQWNFKKGMKIAGPSYESETGGSIAPTDAANRGRLLSEKSKAAKPENAGGTYLDEVEVEKERQDDVIDQISDSVQNLKALATEMGSEIRKGIDAIEKVNEDVTILNVDLAQANKRASKILKG